MKYGDDASRQVNSIPASKQYVNDIANPSWRKADEIDIDYDLRQKK